MQIDAIHGQIVLDERIYTVNPVKCRLSRTGNVECDVVGVSGLINTMVVMDNNTFIRYSRKRNTLMPRSANDVIRRK
ncbi:MAG: hypothetical protein CVV44_14270 [Spirochaetae bacterium HGW-Spirochaetae-1]|jgi:hypothetical protein|nr:MAG: hypothetical protein CVV44_14270 [Spirochaetae bacterium HGW-Spirochaetae-1]